ncbi:MAG: arsenate reductase (glutaredoxin) [Verrucomicrobiota bacterium]|jgi:arsenate reductase|nr:arsenate reductase (glutaredoxin) [Verrucomicrobiota bacterium]
MIIYHNPRCSKSRQALQLLKENGEEPDVIEYLKKPLNQTELADLVKKLKISAHELLRKKEDEYNELGLSPETPEEDILTAIAINPILLERPIIVKGRQALIARPPELLEDLL